MIGIFLSGWSGRMGESLRKLVEERPTEFHLVAGRAGVAAGGEPRVYRDLPMNAPAGVDVVVDFSLATAWTELLEWCVEQKLPLVSGTTGLEEKQKKSLAAAGKKIPILWSPNMSLGVAILTEALETLAKLKGADFQIEEFHHNRKLDRPSGTAIWLQDALEKNVGKELPVPLSIRGGGIFGVHRVHAMTDEETLTFEHQALNREVFARGALVAARWLRDRPAGLYKMTDVLSTKG